MMSTPIARVIRPTGAVLLHSFLILLAVESATAVTQARQPNVLVVLTDDQGWGDLSVNGNTNLSTPNIDSLARDGATFESFYVCQVCAPTRAEFLTGRYYPRTGVSGVSRGEGRMNADETTIADLFQNAGYATGAFGKWHNGTQPPLHPNDRGFDEFYGFTSGHWGHYFSPPLDHNRQRVRGNGFVIDDFTDHAIEFVTANRDRPFFCYVPMNTPHSPMMVDDRFYDPFKDREFDKQHRDPDREDIMMTRAALAMCENIDWNVGRLLGKLDQLQLSDDTIVIFFSDNGPNSYRWNGGMKGRKGAIDEGGLRSPFFIRWPGNISPGQHVRQIGAAIDLLPTLVSLTGIENTASKPIDGADLTPLLRGNAADWPARRIFSMRRDQVSVRTERFRLDSTGKLYDIPVDRGQHHDVSGQHPTITANLMEAAEHHAIEMKKNFEANASRPFHVGYGPTTTLPARDGVEHGTIRRSSKAPNNSFFTNWTSTDDYISWQVDVGSSGTYHATVYYTCAEGDEGSVVQLESLGGDRAQSTVTEVFDPPLYDKSKERVAKSHYFVKDFKPLSLGTIRLVEGTGELRLGAPSMTGDRVIDVHSVELTLQEGADR